MTSNYNEKAVNAGQCFSMQNTCQFCYYCLFIYRYEFFSISMNEKNIQTKKCRICSYQKIRIIFQYIYMVRLHQNGPNDGFIDIILSSYFSLKVMVVSTY